MEEISHMDWPIYAGEAISWMPLVLYAVAGGIALGYTSVSHQI